MVKVGVRGLKDALFHWGSSHATVWESYHMEQLLVLFVRSEVKDVTADWQFSLNDKGLLPGLTAYIVLVKGEIQNGIIYVTHILSYYGKNGSST